MLPINDRLFLAIARKTGVPGPKLLARLKTERGDRTLFEAAVETGALSPEDRARFEKIARKAAKGDLSALEPKKAVPEADGSPAPRRRRALRQSSSELAAVAEPTRTPSSGATKAKDPVPPPPVAVEAVSTPAARSNLAPIVALGVAALVLVAALGTSAVVVLRRIRAKTSPNAVASVASTVAPVASSAAPVAVELDQPPEPPASTDENTDGGAPAVDRIAAEKAARTILGAEKLEIRGKEDEAIALFDVVLDEIGDPTAQKILADARGRMLERLRDRIGEVDTLVESGKVADAKKLLAWLRSSFPAVLKPELDEAQGQIAAFEKKGQAPEKAPAADAKKDPAPAGPRPEELARFAKMRRSLNRSLGNLDPIGARALLEKTLPFVDPTLEAGYALDRKRCEAIESLAASVQAGFKKQVGNEVELEVRAGPKIFANLVRVDGLSLVVSVEGQELPLPLGFLSPATLLAAGEKFGAADPEAFAFGKGVLLSCVGDKRGALDALALATHVPEALLLKQQLEKDETLLGPPLPTVDPNAVAQGPSPRHHSPEDDTPLTPEERKAAVEKAKEKGHWKVAFLSKYYDFYSNGPAEEVRALAAIMDLMCDEYRRIFGHKQPIARPFPVWLYANQSEFMAQTRKPNGVGGFYDGEKIVAFHGRLRELTTEVVLFHEGTHQFQGLVLGDNMWKAKLWFIEGLAVYFESSEVNGRHLVTDVIPQARLAQVKRDLHSGNYVRLRDLIRMDRRQFSAREYAYSWSLIYFLCHGTKGGLERFKKYFEGVKEGKDGVRLFEELFDKPIDRIEDAWREWVLNL
jgi:hypothetical protein